MSKDTSNLPWHVAPHQRAAHAKLEFKRFLADLALDPDYQASVKRRALAGRLNPHVESKLWDHVAGAPEQNVSVAIEETQEDLSKLTSAQLRERSSEVDRMLREAESIERAIPAEYRKVG